ncbi:MAG: ATP-binding protein [Chloroflexota bacterium]
MSDSLEELRAQLKQNNDGQALLLEITQRIAAGGSLGAMLPDIINATLRVSHADGIRVVLNQSDMPLTYATGPAAGKMVKFDPLIVRLVAERGTIESSDLSTAEDSELAPLSDAAGAFIGLPLTALRTLQGVLWVAYEKPQQFAAGEIALLSILAGQTALAVANAHAFNAARRGREQLAAILDSSADPVLVIDEKEAVLLINPAAERAFGVSTSAVIGKPVGEVINAPSLVEMLKATSQVNESIEWQNEAGQSYSPRLSDMCNDQGELTGRVLLLRNITPYKNLRDNQTEFVSTVSHDLRSPLTYMHGYATMMPMVGQLNEKQQSFANKIIAGIAQMTDLVDKILDASRLDPEGNYDLNRETCDVAKVVSDIASMHQQPAEKKNLALIVEIDGTLPILNLDDVMLRRALNNLVDNAIKYTPEKGIITVGAKIKDNNLIVFVRDTGLGISEENQKHLFERFRRVRRREHQAVKGNGLGLFIVRSVAQKHGGDAWVESKEGEGSTFAISIPLEGPNLIGGEAQKTDGPIEKAVE